MFLVSRCLMLGAVTFSYLQNLTIDKLKDFLFSQMPKQIIEHLGTIPELMQERLTSVLLKRYKSFYQNIVPEQQSWELKGHIDLVYSAAFSPDGKLVDQMILPVFHYCFML